MSEDNNSQYRDGSDGEIGISVDERICDVCGETFYTRPDALIFKCTKCRKRCGRERSVDTETK